MQTCTHIHTNKCSENNNNNNYVHCTTSTCKAAGRWPEAIAVAALKRAQAQSRERVVERESSLERAWQESRV